MITFEYQDLREDFSSQISDSPAKKTRETENLLEDQFARELGRWYEGWVLKFGRLGRNLRIE